MRFVYSPCRRHALVSSARSWRSNGSPPDRCTCTTPSAAASANTRLHSSVVSSSDRAANSATRAKAVAPFLDEQTVLVLHAELARADPEALLTKFAEILPFAAPPKEIAQATVTRGIGDEVE